MLPNGPVRKILPLVYTGHPSEHGLKLTA